MKNFLFILSILLCCTAKAQDSCRLSFLMSSDNISDLHKAKLQKHMEERTVTSLRIHAPFINEQNVSKNRYLTELRVQSLRESLMALGVPLSKMRTNIYLTELKSEWNSIVVDFNFTAKKGARVLKNTPVVQISEVNYTPRKVVMPEKIQEKKIEQEQAEAIEAVKKNELLSVTDFKKNETINLPNLLFEGGTHFILPGSESVLNELVAVMKAKPKLSIELQGHICCKMGGMDGYDATTGLENLSVMRAKVVYLYLISKGINKDRMSYRGFGSSRKIYPDDLFNTANAMQNRRVEVLVLGVD